MNHAQQKNDWFVFLCIWLATQSLVPGNGKCMINRNCNGFPELLYLSHGKSFPGLRGLTTASTFPGWQERKWLWENGKAAWLLGGTEDSGGKHIAHLSHQASPYPHELQGSRVELHALGQEGSTLNKGEEGQLPGVVKHLHLHTNSGAAGETLGLSDELKVHTVSMRHQVEYWWWGWRQVMTNDVFYAIDISHGPLLW